jgi:hypothetical protein
MQQFILIGVLSVFGLPLTLGCCLCGDDDPVPNPDAPGKYAVLASTEIATEDDVKYNSEFWYDLVLTYCTLIEQGFESDNIFVLYGDGTDGTSKYDSYEGPFCGDVTKITDIGLKGSANIAKDNLCNVLCCLSSGRPAEMVSGTCECLTSGDTGIGGFRCPDGEIPWLTDDDFLIAWVKGHGSAKDCRTSLAFKSGTTLRDAELAGLLSGLKPDRWALMFETCDAGGWIEDFPGDDTSVVVISSGDPQDSAITECKETSWTATYAEKDSATGAETNVFHGRFTYWVNAALRQLDLAGSDIDSDADGNNLVSILEGFVATKQKIGDEESVFAASTETDLDAKADLGGKMHPAVSSQVGIAPCVFVRLDNPGKNDDVFSMDHDGDNATIPSVPSPAIPLESPDLWVRHVHLDEVIQEHQEPKAGQDNHVYARVYNIGCADPSPVEVKFYYSEYSDLTACGDPTQWTPIGDDCIEALPVGESHVFHAMWPVGKLPELGPYCLIVTLSAPLDEPVADASVASDNNKAQIKLEVVAGSS